jgi:hypothetical protein
MTPSCPILSALPSSGIAGWATRLAGTQQQLSPTLPSNHLSSNAVPYWASVVRGRAYVQLQPQPMAMATREIFFSLHYTRAALQEDYEPTLAVPLCWTSEHLHILQPSLARTSQYCSSCPGLQLPYACPDRSC